MASLSLTRLLLSSSLRGLRRSSNAVQLLERDREWQWWGRELSWSQCTAVRRRSTAVEGSTRELGDSSAAENSSDNTGKGLFLSDSCVKQLHRVTAGDSEMMLRVVVEGGGCSGFQYKFDLDSNLNSDDKVFAREGAKLVIDELSLSFLEGSMVDYHRELIRSSFRVVDNPNAELGCSCGASFALK